MSIHELTKPVVHYSGPVEFIDEGDRRRARLVPVDHYNTFDVENYEPAITSSVIEWGATTGRLVTKHTVYLPVRAVVLS